MEQLSEFTLCLPGDPVPKGRPRVYNGHAITPKRTVRAEERLFAEFRLKYPQAKPFQCPVRLEAEFWMSHRGRPDLDNLLKLVLDSLNGVAYVDDAQVVESHASKRMPDLWVYGSKGRYRKRKSGDPYTCCGHEYEPHLSIRIKPLPGMGAEGKETIMSKPINEPRMVQQALVSDEDLSFELAALVPTGERHHERGQHVHRQSHQTVAVRQDHTHQRAAYGRHVGHRHRPTDRQGRRGHIEAAAQPGRFGGHHRRTATHLQGQA